MLHLPILRYGRPYRSLDVIELADVSTGEPVARVSQANPGLISRDLLGAGERRRVLQRMPVRRLLEICREAARHFAESRLPVDPVDGVTQSPDEYVEWLSRTTGMPRTLVRANMAKVRYVLEEMETVLGGLTRGLDLAVLDAGSVEQGGSAVSYVGETEALGVILPSNSPGVHSLWLPAIPLKVPLVLKPGRQEPWTPLRVTQSLLASGCPPEALGFYPSDYSGATQILLRCGRSMLFGDESTVRKWRRHAGVQIHGTGFSKVLLDERAAAAWRDHLDLMEASIADNGGRSCLNASGVWLPSHGTEVAHALAERVARIEARPLDDPEARLAAFSDPRVARAISDMIDRFLQVPGAEDVTARFRPRGRLVEAGGCTFLLPTIVHCVDPEHPLAHTELLFPFAAVVEVPRRELLSRIGPTLVATVVTDDPAFVADAMAARSIDRLNLGAIPTSRVSWDQPHEGNLFEHLYRRRAFQASGPWRATA